ncbi:MAG TPA: tail fiber domain-containing protein [Chitinophagaceae bacterium]|nr:tail fiber domain-containing protein [Chitinophagaceae bacterium]
MKKAYLIVAFLSAIHFSSAQNVGIGTDSPTRAKLEVHGAAGEGATSAIFGGESTGISLQRNWPSIGFNQYYSGYLQPRYIGNGFAAVQYLDPNNGGLFFDLYNSGTTNNLAGTPKRALSLFQSGNMAIGASYNNSSLSVSRNPGSIATAYLFGTTHHSTFNFGTEENTYLRAGRDSGMVVINDIPGSKIIMSGLVGINTATPASPLEVRQHLGKGIVIVAPPKFYNWEFHVGGSGLYGPLYFDYNGDFKALMSPSDGHMVTASDQRLKKNIQGLPSLLGKIMQLQPVEYEMINHNPYHEKTLGFIAQDVKKVFPELVQVIQDSARGNKEFRDLHTLNYSGFGVLAIKAVQEQQQLIQAQQAEIDELKKIVSELRRLVTNK